MKRHSFFSFVILLLTLVFAAGSHASSRHVINDATRLHAASIEFAEYARRHDGSLRAAAEKLSREAVRFRSSLSSGASAHQVQARYDELVKYYYRLERSYRTHSQYHGFSRGLDRSYRDIAASFHHLNRGYLAMQSDYRPGHHKHYGDRRYGSHDAGPAHSRAYGRRH